MHGGDEAQIRIVGLGEGAGDTADSARAGLLPPMAFGGKEGEHAVANEFEHIAALGPHRLHHHFEIGAQQLEKRVGSQPFRQVRVAAQVGDHDRCVDLGHRTALECAAGHAARGASAEIDFEEARR